MATQESIELMVDTKLKERFVEVNGGEVLPALDGRTRISYKLLVTVLP